MKEGRHTHMNTKQPDVGHGNYHHKMQRAIFAKKTIWGHLTKSTKKEGKIGPLANLTKRRHLKGGVSFSFLVHNANKLIFL